MKHLYFKNILWPDLSILWTDLGFVLFGTDYSSLIDLSLCTSFFWVKKTNKHYLWVILVIFPQKLRSVINETSEYLRVGWQFLNGKIPKKYKNCPFLYFLWSCCTLYEHSLSVLVQCNINNNYHIWENEIPLLVKSHQNTTWVTYQHFFEMPNAKIVFVCLFWNIS